MDRDAEGVLGAALEGAGIRPSATDRADVAATAAFLVACMGRVEAWLAAGGGPDTGAGGGGADGPG